MSARSELDTALDAVVKTRHVSGAAVCDTDGAILLSAMPEFYEDYVLEDAFKTLAATVSTIRELGIKADQAAYDFGEMRLLVRDLRSGLLVLLCDANVQVALLNVAMRVTEKRVTKLLRDPNLLSPPPSEPKAAPVAKSAAVASTDPEPAANAHSKDNKEDWSKSVILFEHDG